MHSLSHVATYKSAHFSLFRLFQYFHVSALSLRLSFALPLSIASTPALQRTTKMLQLRKQRFSTNQDASSVVGTSTPSRPPARSTG